MRGKRKSCECHTSFIFLSWSRADSNRFALSLHFTSITYYLPIMLIVLWNAIGKVFVFCTRNCVRVSFQPVSKTWVMMIPFATPGVPSRPPFAQHPGVFEGCPIRVSKNRIRVQVFNRAQGTIHLSCSPPHTHLKLFDFKNRMYFSHTSRLKVTQHSHSLTSIQEMLFFLNVLFI